MGAHLAWALARLGRRQETEEAIENALKATAKNVPDLAITYHRAGLAMQALGEEAAARDYFERAMQTDPSGRRGTLAKAAMQAENLRAVDQVRVY
jgi:Tfp pilus assembly protein PilF